MSPLAHLLERNDLREPAIADQLPRGSKHWRVQDNRPGILEAEQGPPRVLVVDDDPDACEILSHALRHLGYVPVCEQDSTSALPRLLGERFHVVLMDLVMPGLSGFDLLRMTRSRGSAAPIVAVSSFSEFRHRAAQVGFDAFIEKPIELSKLRPLLDGLMSSA
jgi:CheY-like chemotaxis protein